MNNTLLKRDISRRDLFILIDGMIHQTDQIALNSISKDYKPRVQQFPLFGYAPQFIIRDRRPPILSTALYIALSFVLYTTERFTLHGDELWIQQKFDRIKQIW